MTSTLEHWQRWTALCALGLCPPDTRAALEHFVAVRFRRYIQVYMHRTAVTQPGALMPTPADAWHALETWTCLRHTRQGKTYKQWLLAHAPHPMPPNQHHIESAASLLVRDAVREYLRRETSPSFMVSMDRSIGSGSESGDASLHDLIPDPCPARATAESRDLDRLAADESTRAFEVMPRRERMALLARELGLPLSHPAVVQHAGCSRSRLYSAYTEALHTIALHIRAHFSSEDRSTQAELSIRLFEALRSLLRAWGRTEPACAFLFMLSEEERYLPLSGAA